MKKFFKFLSVALLATTVCVSLASCGEENGDDPATEQGGGEGEGEGEGGGGSVTIPDGLTVKFDNAAAWTPFGSEIVYYQGAVICQNMFASDPSTFSDDEGADWGAKAECFINPAADGSYITGIVQANLINYYTNCHTYLILTTTNNDTIKMGQYSYIGKNGDNELCGNFTVEGANVDATNMTATFRATYPMLSVADYFTGDQSTSRTIIKNMVVSVGKQPMQSVSKSVLNFSNSNVKIDRNAKAVAVTR